MSCIHITSLILIPLMAALASFLAASLAPMVKIPIVVFARHTDADVRDAGETRAPLGTAIIAVGAVGEFGPLIAISLFPSGRPPGVASMVPGFVLVTGIAIYFAGQRHPSADARV